MRPYSGTVEVDELQGQQPLTPDAALPQDAATHSESDLSSIDGAESPPHRRAKLKAAEKRQAARRPLLKDADLAMKLIRPDAAYETEFCQGEARRRRRIGVFRSCHAAC